MFGGRGSAAAAWRESSVLPQAPGESPACALARAALPSEPFARGIPLAAESVNGVMGDMGQQPWRARIMEVVNIKLFCVIPQVRAKWRPTRCAGTGAGHVTDVCMHEHAVCPHSQRLSEGGVAIVWVGGGTRGALTTYLTPGGAERHTPMSARSRCSLPTGKRRGTGCRRRWRPR